MKVRNEKSSALPMLSLRLSREAMNLVLTFFKGRPETDKVEILMRASLVTGKIAQHISNLIFGRQTKVAD